MSRSARMAPTAPVASASASCFPRRSHGGIPYGGTRGMPSPPLSPRPGAARRLRRVLARSGGGGGGGEGRGILDPLATPLQILGLDASASYTAAQLKAAFRARVKEFHPDVCKDTENADLIMIRVLEAYEILSGNQGMMIERNNVDPFDEPECAACDIFVNELLCIGTGCPYSCVKRAPHAFAFADDTGTARASSQGMLIIATLLNWEEACLVTVMTTMSNLLLGSVQESAYTMSHPANVLFWRKFLQVC